MRVLLALIFVAGLAHAQSPSDCSVDGIAVNSVTGAPVARAYIIVNNEDGKVATDTDETGKWRIERAPCGRVEILSSKTGYLTLPTRIEPGRPVILKPADALHELKIQMIPQGAIYGRVTDDHGEPIYRGSISLWSSFVIGGQRRTDAYGSSVTDDQGNYRFSGLRAGRYFVCADLHSEFDQAPTRPHGGVCFPGQPESGASGIEMAAGSEQRIDLTVPPALLVSISGKVDGATKGTTVSVFTGLGYGRRQSHEAPVRPDKTFTLTDISPGTYSLVARGDGIVGVTPVIVDRADLSDVVVRMQDLPTATITFRYKETAGGKVPDQVTLPTVLDSAMMGEYRGDDSKDGHSLIFRNLLPGQYRMRFDGHPQSPWRVASIRIGNQDILDTEIDIGPSPGEIEVTLTDDGGVIEGKVSGKDWPLGAVVIVSGPKGFVTLTTANSDGHFKSSSLPPGDYTVSAWDTVNVGVEYRNPDWMQKNSKGKSVTVAPSATVTVDLDLQIAPDE